MTHEQLLHEINGSPAMSASEVVAIEGLSGKVQQVQKLVWMRLLCANRNDFFHCVLFIDYTVVEP